VHLSTSFHDLSFHPLRTWNSSKSDTMTPAGCLQLLKNGQKYRAILGPNADSYGVDLHACTVLLQGCNALGEPCIAQCLFIACTEYDHLLFTACSLSADIVAGNPRSGAVLVDPHEDSPSRPTQVSRSASRGLEAVFGRSSGRPWSTTAEWAPVEWRSAWGWPVIYQDSADPWTPSGPFGRVGFPYYMICGLIYMLWTYMHNPEHAYCCQTWFEHDFMFWNMISCLWTLSHVHNMFKTLKQALNMISCSITWFHVPEHEIVFQKHALCLRTWIMFWNMISCSGTWFDVQIVIRS